MIRHFIGQSSVALRSVQSLVRACGVVSRARWGTRLASCVWFVLSLTIPVQAVSMYQLQLRGMAHRHSDIKPDATTRAMAQPPPSDAPFESVDAVRLFGGHESAAKAPNLSPVHRHQHTGYHAHGAAWVSLLTQWLDPDAQQSAQHDASDASYSLNVSWAVLSAHPRLCMAPRALQPSSLVASHISDALLARLDRPPQHFVPA